MATSLEYLHALAEEAGGEYGSFVTTDNGDTDTLICSKLINSALAASEFANMHVLIESGAAVGEVGQAKTLVRSTGALSTSDVFSTSILTGVTFSLYNLLPPIDGDNVLPSWLKIANWAVRRVPVERTIEVSGVTGQHYYTISQATYPWFTDEERIRWIEYPTATADEIPRRMADADWEWDANGSTKRLYFRSAPFQTSETFRVKVMAPGNSLLKKNGVWTEQTSQTAGMSLYTSGVADEALPDVDDVVTMGTALLYRALSRIRQPTAQVAEWLTKMQPSMAAAKALIHTGFPEDRTADIVRMRPARVGYRGR